MSYRMLRRQLELDDDALDEPREELVEIQRVAADEGGRVLVWVGQADPASATLASAAAPNAEPASACTPRPYTPEHLADRIPTSRSALEGELEQVTLLLTDVKGSMELAGARGSGGLAPHPRPLLPDPGRRRGPPRRHCRPGHGRRALELAAARDLLGERGVTERAAQLAEELNG